MTDRKAAEIKFTLSKTERLNNKRVIKELFMKGSSFYLGPIKVQFLRTTAHRGSDSNQVLFTVPKKQFKRAVDRNLLKRRMREVYRIHNSTLVEIQNQKLLIAYIYIGKEIVPFSVLEEKLIASFQRLNEKLIQIDNE